MRGTVAVRAATFGGVRTRVLEQLGEGPPILLLHGFADSADTWRPLMRAMAWDERHVIAVDLPLFGRADRPAVPPVLPMLDEFTGALVEQVAGDDEVLIVGNSLGGLLAMRAAQRQESPIRGVVPIGPAGLGLQPWIDTVERATGALAVAARAPIPVGLLRRAAGELYRVLSASQPVDAQAVRDFASHVGRGDPARLFRLAEQLLPELREQEVVVLDLIECPVLLIWGGRDRLCPPHGAQRVTERLPHARLELLPRHGHCVQIEDPGLVRSLVLEVDGAGGAVAA